MNEPRNYQLNKTVTIIELLKAGFKEPKLQQRRVLYRFDDTRSPYVTVELGINDMELSVDVLCNDGTIYAPFYNPELRHDNKVYDQVVRKFNTYMDELVRMNVLRRSKNGNY